MSALSRHEHLALALTIALTAYPVVLIVEPTEPAGLVARVSAGAVGSAVVIGMLVYVVPRARISIPSLALLTAPVAPCFAWVPWQFAVSPSNGLGFVVVGWSITAEQVFTLLATAFFVGLLATTAEICPLPRRWPVAPVPALAPVAVPILPASR